MSRVLIVTKTTECSSTINQKLKKGLDCDFVALNEIQIKEKLQSMPDCKLVVIYVSNSSAEEEIEVKKFLMTDNNLPIIMAGEKNLLRTYFRMQSPKIIRYIATPVLFSTYITAIKEILIKIDTVDITNEFMNVSEITEMDAPKQILIVDDDVTILKTINNWLSELFRVSVAKSGAMALQLLANEKPDLILLDYNMPVCDGVQTLKMIRAEENLKDIPVFFLTGVDDAEEVKRALDLKPEGYILKSAGAGNLISRIEEFL